MRQSWETMTSVSAGHIILTPTQPVGSGRPQRGSNPGPPHQESRALPTELPRPPSTKSLTHSLKHAQQLPTEGHGDLEVETGKELGVLAEGGVALLQEKVWQVHAEEEDSAQSCPCVGWCEV